MARIRSIKPEICTSDQVADCSPTARLLFILSWLFADDGGVMPFSVKRLKMCCFPGDFMSEKDMTGFVDELLAAGLYAEFEADGKRWLYVTGWKHQKIEKPRYIYPVVGPSTKFADHSPTTRRPVADSSCLARARGTGVDRSGPEWNNTGGDARGGTRQNARTNPDSSPPLTLPAAPPSSADRAPGLKKKPAGLPGMVLPAGVNQAAWAEWDCERRRRGGKSAASWTPLAQRKAAGLMARHTPAEQQAMVDTSIQAGYQGLFSLNGKGNGGGRAKTFREIDAGNEAAAAAQRDEAAKARHPELFGSGNTYEGEVPGGD